jgi:hypothetical protein
MERMLRKTSAKIFQIANNFIKFCESIGFHRIGNIIVMIGFIYQFIYSTISYCKYETVFDLKSEVLSQETPSVSFCIKSHNEFLRVKQNRSNESIVKYLYRSIMCKIRYNNETKLSSKCGKRSEIIVSLTPYAYRCITFFSQLTVSKITQSSKMEIIFAIHNNIEMPLIIHPTRTPPHFFRNHIFYKTKYFYSLKFFSTKEKLLPFPYGTNCNYYEKNSLETNSYKSREHCIYEDMKRLEHDKCKSNRRWLFMSLNDTRINDKKINLMKNCSFHFDRVLLKEKCRKNCYNEYYENRLINELPLPGNKYKTNLTFIRIQKLPERELIYNHLPKMDLMQYFGSIGGLIAFWFGYSLY